MAERFRSLPQLPFRRLLRPFDRYSSLKPVFSNEQSGIGGSYRWSIRCRNIQEGVCLHNVNLAIGGCSHRTNRWTASKLGVEPFVLESWWPFVLLRTAIQSYYTIDTRVLPIHLLQTSPSQKAKNAKGNRSKDKAEHEASCWGRMPANLRQRNRLVEQQG